MQRFYRVCVGTERLRKFTVYSSTPLLLIMQPSTVFAKAADASGQSLPLKAYEPTVEIRDRKSRSVFIEASYSVETGEAERIAVDWAAKGGEGGTSRESCNVRSSGRDIQGAQWNPICRRSVPPSRCFMTVSCSWSSM